MPAAAEANAPAEPTPQTRRRFRRGLRWLTAALVLLFAWTVPGTWRETQRREATLPQLDALVRRSSYDGPLLALWGARLAEAHDFPAAAAALERAVAVGEKNPDVWLTLAASFAASGDRRAVTVLLVAQRDAASPEIKSALDRAQSLGPAAAPVVLARAICPEGPAPLTARYAAGSFWNRPVAWWGRRHPAQSGFETRREWAAQAPEDAQAQRLWGEALAQNRRYAEAEAVLAKAVSLAPDSPAAHLALAELEDREALPSQAILEYAAAVRLRPGEPTALLGLGREAMALSLPVSAANAFRQAAQAAPGSPNTWIGLGAADAQAGQHPEEALTAFQTASRLASPLQTEDADDYALALRQNNRFVEAETLLRRHLAVVPTDGLGHFRLASLLLDNDPTPAREGEAEAETRTALRLGLTRAAAYQQLGRLLLDRGRTSEAVAILRTGLAANPNDVGVMQTLARAYRKNRQEGLAAPLSRREKETFDALQAILVLKAQVQRTPASLPLHQRLQQLYRKVGAQADADWEGRVVVLLRTHPELSREWTQTLESLIHDALSRH